MGPVIGFIASVFFGAAAGASAVYVLAVNLARIALLSLASKLTAPKIDLTEAARNKLLTVRATVQPQGYTYGQDMLSGPLIFANTAGNSNNDLHRVVALHGREIEEFLAYRIDDTDIVVGADIAAETGVVSGGRFQDVLTIDVRHGTATQAAITAMTSAFGSLWTAAHRCRTWSLLYTKMTLEGNNTAYENGIPQNLRALCKGHKVYDPRLDSTQPGGASPGPHRADDDTTWEYSTNPALCLADFLIWEEVGMGEETDRIDYSLVMIAADICEEQVPIPPCASPQVSFQDRYTCNLTFFATANRGEIKEMLETAMLGRSVFSQGQWRIWAGAAQTPDVVLTEANLAGPIQMQASSGSQERYNRVRGKFIDPTRDYSANAYPEIRNAGFEASDTEVRYQILDINSCNNSFEAQRDAIIRLRQSRNQRIIVWAGNWSCFRIQPGTIVQLNVAELGLNTSPLTKWFVTEWSLQADGSGVSLTMVEENDSVWAEVPCEDYVIRSPTGELIFQNQGGDVQLTDARILNARQGSCNAGVRLRASDNPTLPGRVEYQAGDGTWSHLLVPPNDWLIVPGEYWVRATLDEFGPLNVGTVDVWEQLFAVSPALSREYSIVQGAEGTKQANVILEIARDALGAEVLANGFFHLQASVPPVLPFLPGAESICTIGPTPGFSALASLSFRSNGQIFGNCDAAPDQFQAGTWWPLEPDVGIGSQYAIRCQSITSGPAWFSEPVAVGTWIDIGSARVWQQRRSSSIDGPGMTKTVGFFQIRKGASPAPVLASGSYSAEAIVTA